MVLLHHPQWPHSRYCRPAPHGQEAPGRLFLYTKGAAEATSPCPRPAAESGVVFPISPGKERR